MGCRAWHRASFLFSCVGELPAGPSVHPLSDVGLDSSLSDVHARQCVAARHQQIHTMARSRARQCWHGVTQRLQHSALPPGVNSTASELQQRTGRGEGRCSGLNPNCACMGGVQASTANRLVRNKAGKRDRSATGQFALLEMVGAISHQQATCFDRLPNPMPHTLTMM